MGVACGYGMQKVAKISPVTIARHAQSTKITSSQYLYNISRKKGGMKFIYCMQINIKPSYKLVLLILMVVSSHAESTQSTKFTKSSRIVRCVD